MPEWFPDFIVILILCIIFAIPIGYMIYSRVTKGHCGSCGCGCGAARSSSKLRKIFKKDFQAKKAKDAQAKKENCCCCGEAKKEVVEAKVVENKTTDDATKSE